MKDVDLGELVKSIPPNTENSMQYGYDENDNNNMSNETKCETNYSIITKWNDVNTYNYMQLTKHNKYPNDDVYTDACVVHIMRWARTKRALLHTWWCHLTPHWLKIWVLSFVIHGDIHGRTSLTRLSLSTSTCSSLSFPSTSCTPSCTLSSTTRSSWKACATPPTWGVTTPNLPHRLWAQLRDLRRAQRLIGSLLLHYPVIGPGHGWRDTRQAAHRGTPRTSRLLRTRRRVSQSVVVVCCVRWIRATCGREKCRSISWFWCHKKHVQCSQQVFWKHPSWESGR